MKSNDEPSKQLTHKYMMKKIYSTLLLALMSLTAFAQEQNDTTYVMFDFNANPWNYPLTTAMKGWGPSYDDETGAIFEDRDFTWPVADGSDKLVTVTVTAVDLDEYNKPAVYACVDNDIEGEITGYTGEKINVLFTNPGTTMRFKAPDGYKFGKLVFYNFHVPNFMVGEEYEEEFSYEYGGNTFKHKLKVWTPVSPKKNQYGYDIWDGDDKNILFNYPYFTAHFMKIDIRLVPDGTTGINRVQKVQQPSGIVTALDGRTFSSDAGLHKGVYIVNGKKHVVK